MRRHPIWMLAVAVLAPVACTTARPEQGYLERRVPNAGVKSSQLETLIVDATLVLSQEVERAADRIIAGSPESPTIRANALRWKTYAISAAFAAGSRGDPAASLLDLWSLCLAQEHLFQEKGASLFGDRQDIALETARSLTTRFQAFADTVVPLPEDRADARRWAAHLAERSPVTDLYFVRRMLEPEEVERFSTDVGGIVDVAHGLQRSAASLQKLLRAHAAILPRQLRWQVELATLDLAVLYGIDPREIGLVLGRLEHNVGALGTDVDTLSRGISREVDTALRALTGEREATLDRLDAMLSQTREWTSLEVAGSFEALARERELVLAALEDQRRAAVAEVETAAERASERAAERFTGAVRQLLREALIGLALLWAVILVTGTGAWLLVRRLARSRHPPA